MKRLHVCLTIVTLLALPLASQAALVGYWDFDDNVLDQSGNSNDGTILGNPSPPSHRRTVTRNQISYQ